MISNVSSLSNFIAGVSHTHTDYSKIPIQGNGAATKEGILQQKQVFEIFHGNTIGENVTLDTPTFGLIHGCVITAADIINIRFFIGELVFNFDWVIILQ